MACCCFLPTAYSVDRKEYRVKCNTNSNADLGEYPAAATIGLVIVSLHQQLYCLLLLLVLPLSMLLLWWWYAYQARRGAGIATALSRPRLEVEPS